MLGDAHSKCALERLRKSVRRKYTMPPPPYKGTSLHRQELRPYYILLRNRALRGCYTLALPHYRFVFPHPYFVKETRRKNLRGKVGKIFRALDNDDKLKLKTADGTSCRPP